MAKHKSKGLIHRFTKRQADRACQISNSLNECADIDSFDSDSFSLQELCTSVAYFADVAAVMGMRCQAAETKLKIIGICLGTPVEKRPRNGRK